MAEVGVFKKKVAKLLLLFVRHSPSPMLAARPLLEGLQQVSDREAGLLLEPVRELCGKEQKASPGLVL
jgi:hypothetical protein